MSDPDGPDEDPIEDELRRLFSDERLDVRTTEGAGQVIVAGARRVRRRRAALTGGGATVAVLALVGGGLLLGGMRSADEPSGAPVAAPPGTSESAAASLTSEAASSPSVDEPRGLPSQTSEPSSTLRDTDSRTPSRTTSSADASSTTADGSVLAAGPTFGPGGYERLTLGMSYSDAAATGMLAQGQQSPPPENACSTYELAEGTAAIRDITISASRGIVVFRAGGARTAEGVGAGSSLDQVRAAYPGLTSDGSGYSAPAGQNGRYYFTTTGDTVDEVQLRAADPTC